MQFNNNYCGWNAFIKCGNTWVCLGLNVHVLNYHMKLNGLYIATADSYHFSDTEYEISEVQQEVTLKLVSTLPAKEEHSRTVQLKNGSAACKLQCLVNTNMSLQYQFATLVHTNENYTILS